MNLNIIFAITVFISSSSSSPIQYGNVVKNIKQFPYVVHLRISKADIKTNEILTDGCGGALLKPGIVITAGHCLLKREFIITNIKITAGSIYRGDEDDEMETRLAKGFKIHKNFERKPKSFPKYDIAVVWLTRSFHVKENPNIELAQLLDRDIKAGMVGDIAGWGQLETGYPAKGLRHAKLKKISDSVCKNRYDYKLYPNTFCVISLDLKSGISFGDSGGPFIYQGLFAGIVSYGYTKTVQEKSRKLVSDTTKPVVITDIRKYSEWIGKNLEVGSPQNICTKDQQKYCAL